MATTGGAEVGAAAQVGVERQAEGARIFRELDAGRELVANVLLESTWLPSSELELEPEGPEGGQRTRVVLEYGRVVIGVAVLDEYGDAAVLRAVAVRATYRRQVPVVGKIFLDVQPEEVWAFWRFMQDHFRTSVINKNSALEMQLVARCLEALGIQSKDRFLKNFTTTLGRRIYTPFEVGSPKSGWELWHQIVICVHEHQHVVQHDREGLSYEVSYLADPRILSSPADH